MKLKIYNTLNQKLHSEQIAKLLQYGSDNFAGALSSTSPVTVTTDKWKWANTTVDLIGAGIFFSLEELTTTDKTILDNKIWCIAIDLDKFDDNNILTNESPGIKVQEVNGTVENSTTIPGTYVIKIEGQEDWEYKYDTKIFNGLVGTSTKQLIIPIIAKVDGEPVILIGNKDKSSLEDFLTAAVYEQLKKYIDETFVWHEGGKTKVGEYSKGDIGNLNITGSNISSNNNKLVLEQTEISAPNIPEENNGKVIVINNEGQLEYNIPTIQQGGTGADNSLRAKNNLGITYGKVVPTRAAAEGDIYFYILPEGN